MSQKTPSLMEKFHGQSATTRTFIIGGVAVFLLFTVMTIYTDGGQRRRQQQQQRVQPDNLIVNSGRGVNTQEDVQAELESARRKMADQERKLKELGETLNKSVAQEGSSTDGRWDEISGLVAEVQALREQVNAGKAGGQPQAPAQGDGSLSAKLPGVRDTIVNALGGAPAGAKGGQPSGQGTGAVEAAPPPAEPAAAAAPARAEIQVVGAERPKQSEEVAEVKSKPAAYLPSGTNFEAVLLNGMDASTAISANRNPTPALLRVKSDAILPNMFAFNVRECFVLVGGFGNLSSERVEMRTETLSCVAENGEVYEGKIEGYVVGEDGKVGARGRVVSKQGQILARSFMAGFASGLGSAFTPQPVQALNLSGEGSQQFQYPDPENVLGSGLSRGFNRSSQALSQFYIKLAEQMFPIVELDAARKMTIVLIKGAEMRMDKKQRR